MNQQRRGHKMQKPRNYTPRTIALAHALVLFVHHAMGALIVLFACLIWMLSPNNFVAFFIILFGTTLPFVLVVFLVNLLAKLALRGKNFFGSDVPCVLVKRLFASLMVLYGKIIHGYEIHGGKNLPQEGGGLLVYYHPQVPFDCLYLMSELYLTDGRQLSAIINRHLVKPLSGLCTLFNLHDQRNRLVKDLQEGQLYSVAPGGDLEGAFSENYELFWNGRMGFAEVAKQCGVPVIPMFTVNSQEATPLTTYGLKDILKKVYEETKRVICLPILCFPVKLRIIIGKPLFCNENESPAEFAERVKAAIHDLRDKHQRLPGNLIWALLERFGCRPYNEAAYKSK